MSDAAEAEPDAQDAQDVPDADAWATACEEDLAAEKARRRAEYGPQYGSAAEELRRLADAVSEKVSELGKPLGVTMASVAAQGVAQQLIAQAKAAIEPVVERNPQFFDHLAAAGGELLAAYRAAVTEAEGRWTSGSAGGSGAGGPAESSGSVTPGPFRPSGTSGASASIERIDLDKEPGENPGESPGESKAPGEIGEAGRDSGPAEADEPDAPGAGSDGQNPS
nr:DUF5304 family protein [Streptomyces sp. DSM 40971]